MLALVVAATTRWARAKALADEGKWEARKPSTLATEFAPAVVGPDRRIYVFGGRTNENQGGGG